MRRFPQLLMIVVLLFHPCTGGSWAQELDQTKGKTLSRTYDFKEAGKAMKYSLYIPTSYDKEKKKGSKREAPGRGTTQRSAGSRTRRQEGKNPTCPWSVETDS